MLQRKMTSESMWRKQMPVGRKFRKKGYCPTTTNGSNAFFLFPKIDDK